MGIRMFILENYYTHGNKVYMAYSKIIYLMGISFIIQINLRPDFKHCTK
jgi:hypothetical protein